MKAIPNTDADIIQAIQIAVSLGDAIRKLGLVSSSSKRDFLKKFIRTHNIDVSHFGEMSKSRCNYAVIYKRKHNPDKPQTYTKYKDLRPEAKERKRKASRNYYHRTRGPATKLSRQRAAQGLKYLEDTVHWILEACSKDDRRSGLTGSDLTAETVMTKIKDGCFYCGETSLRMTLDRIDNDLGHSEANTHGCCIRCNISRGNMPYAAWIVIAPSFRRAREQGLFGTWERSFSTHSSHSLTSPSDRRKRHHPEG
jgi:hypothetical protein